MKYKLYSEEDKLAVIELLKKHNLPEPSDSSVGIVCYDDDGNIVGCAFLKPEVYIEPFVSENYLAGFKMFNILLGILISQGINEVYADISYHRQNSYDVLRILRKLGFSVINSGFTLKKEI